MADVYRAFLAAKAAVAVGVGFPCEPAEVHPLLKPHQRACVAWAVRGGRRALFEAFGLGKTLQQLEILRLILAKSGGGRGLIVLPLGVRQEFKRDAAMLGTPVTFIRSLAEASADGIYLTNYETVRDGKLDPRAFQALSLDEAGILRGFGGTKTFREFMRLFEGTGTYRFVATATPSPNEFIELLAYAAFLDVMDVGQAKTRFFRRDSEHADKLTLHEHKAREFWLWVSSWALFVQTPSDLCRCTCHHESNCSASDSGGSPSNPGSQAESVTAPGYVGATAGSPSSPRRIISSRASSAARASSVDVHSGCLRPKHGGKGTRAYAIWRGTTRTGQTTEGAASPCARAGDDSPTSSPTWESPPPAQRSTESTTMGTTSPVIADGRADSTRPETVGPGERRFNPGERGWCDVCRCNEGYDLPSLDVRWHEIPTDHATARAEPDGQGRLLVETNLGVQDAAREKRRSLSGRLSTLLALRADDPAAHRVLWHDLEDERRAIEQAIPGVASVYGSQDLDEREETIIRFSDGEIHELAAKPVMLGSGCNFQRHCAWAIFLGIGFKFNDFIQAIHRVQRFLQPRPVRIDLIYTEAERAVRRQLERKWAQHKHLVAQMTEIIQQYGLAEAAMAQALGRTIGVERTEVAGDGYRLINNDAVEETRTLDSDSVDLIITSIPFATQYEYTPSYNDFGHTDDADHFWRQMDFLTPELLRVLRPGRVAAIHVKDRIAPGGLTGLGFQTVQPFHADAIFHYRRHGFAYLGMKTIVTDVVRENAQTYRLGWTEQCKDGSRMGVGMPEYLLLFRKPPTDRSNGYADVPVVKAKPLTECPDGSVIPYDYDAGKIVPGSGYSRARWQLDAHGFARSNGHHPLTIEELRLLPHAEIYKRWRAESLRSSYDFSRHVDVGEQMEREKRLPSDFMLLPPHSWHPDVWTDVARMRTLNMMQERKGQEMHLCPLQFDLVDRLIVQFSMQGETVFDPFAGLMTVPYCAVRLKRRGVGIELSRIYFRDGVRYVEAAAGQREQARLL